MSERSIRRAREREHRRGDGRAHRGRTGSKVVLATSATLGVTALAAPAAQAGTFVVDSLDDDGSEGTLREEIYDANDNPGADTITFASGLSGEIVLDGGDANVYIDDPLTIQGPGADVISVSGDDQYQIFDAVGAESLSISGLTLTEGYYQSFGGALYANDEIDVTIADSVITDNYAYYGAGIANFDGTTTITNSTLSENIASEDGGALYTAGTTSISGSTLTDNMAIDEYGGAIYQDDVGDSVGTLTITGTTISGGYANNGGGAIYVNDTDPDEATGVSITGSALTGNSTDGNGGAVYVFGADGDIVIDASAISGNSGPYGGGGVSVYESESDVLIRNSTFAGNTTEEGYGGGIVLYDNEAVTIQGSTFSANSSGFDGGGATLWGTEGDVLVESSTFSGNTAGTLPDEGPYNGGGLYSYNRANDDSPPENTDRTIRNTTIVGNTADTGGGIAAWLDSRDGDVTEDVLTLSSTIVANNGPEDLSANQHAGEDPEDQGRFDLGFSLVENPGTVPNTQTPAGSNLFGVDPLLGPLASNGGATQTHLPGLDSPALDKGIANGLGADQRGLARLQDLSKVANTAAGDGTDIGSVELQAANCRGDAVPKIDGTAGDDVLTGAAGPQTINGLEGRDRISGAGGADCVNGDQGRDKLKGNGGKDTVRGGPGRDNVKGQGGKDKLRGQGGKDKLVGGGAKDNLKGGAGKDKLRGGPAKDKLKGQGGKDKINAVDGKRDKVNCGGSKKDRTTVDPQDKVSNNCERVIVKD